MNIFQKCNPFFCLAPPTQRIKLVQIPFSKSVQFGKEDLDELIFMLDDDDEDGDDQEKKQNSKVIVRPSKIQSMLASRACRRSVMIGTGLGDGEMKQIIAHMASMDQPWVGIKFNNNNNVIY
jgi:DNA mismatch repair protein PMS2